MDSATAEFSHFFILYTAACNSFFSSPTKPPPTDDFSNFCTFPITTTNPDDVMHFSTPAEVYKQLLNMRPFLREADVAEGRALNSRTDIYNKNSAAIHALWQYVNSKGQELFREVILYNV